MLACLQASDHQHDGANHFCENARTEEDVCKGPMLELEKAANQHRGGCENDENNEETTHDVSGSNPEKYEPFCCVRKLQRKSLAGLDTIAEAGHIIGQK